MRSSRRSWSGAPLWRGVLAVGMTAACMWLSAAATMAQHGLVDLVASHQGSSDGLQLLLDPFAPRVEILSPASGSVLAGNTVTVSGLAEDPFLEPPPDRTPLFAELRWNVRDAGFVTLDSGTAPIVDGRFSLPDLVLGEGLHWIETAVVDSAGNRSVDVISVVSDIEAPPVALIGIMDGESVLGESVSLDLNFSAPTTLVSVAGVQDGRHFPAGLSEAALTLPLEVGPNGIMLELEADEVPFRFAFTLFRVESLGPIRILEPASGGLTNEREITVRGTVPRGTPFVEIDGRAATMAADGVTFSAEVVLEEGRNTIEALARPFGQRDTLHMTLDTVPPTLGFLFPPDGAWTGEAETALAGFVSEGGSVAATGPGGRVEVATEARVLVEGDPLLGIEPLLEVTFELPSLPLVTGPNEIELRLTDRAGNETIEQLSSTRSEAALALESPAAGAALPGLRADLGLLLFEDVHLESVSSGGRRLPGFDGLALSAGGLPPARVTLEGLPLAPGMQEIRLVYRRDATQAQEVLSFLLESQATRAAMVRGIVTDARTAGPLEGALVSVFANGIELVVPTGPDGRFALAVAPGEVQVLVRREGFAELLVEGRADLTEILIADAELLPWSVGSTPAEGDAISSSTSSVLGLIRDLSSGDPVEGALVRVEQQGIVRSTLTDPAGEYALLDIPAGAFELTIRRVGFFPQRFTIAETEAASIPLDASLEPVPDSVSLVGVAVHAQTGRPEPGVEVKLLGRDGSVQTNDAGELFLEAVPLGDQTLRFRKGEYAERFFVLEDLAPLSEGRPIEQTFAYPASDPAPDPAPTPAPGAASPGMGGPIVVDTDARGRVIDFFTRQPLADARIEIDGRSVTTDSEGVFFVPDLPPLELLGLMATAPGHEPRMIEVMAVPNGEEEPELGLRPTTRGFLSGTILDATTGEPIPRATARVAGSDRLMSSTDDDGRYGIVSVPAGLHDVVFSHPESIPGETRNVLITDMQETTADHALLPRPRTGDLTGRIRESETGAPISGAIVDHPATGSSVTNSEGVYLLSGLPSGLVRVAIEAPGFPSTSRTAAVVAAPDAATPTITVADFELDQTGAEPVSRTARIRSAEGGSIALPGGRFRLDIAPASLTADAEVTLRIVESGTASQGDRLLVDPELGVDEVVAIGPELEILVAPAADGAPLPDLVGPALLTLRYEATDARAAHVAEETLFPYYHDGSQWTALRVLPHLHAVDRIDRVVLVGLQLSETETGVPVLAALATEPPIVVAGGVDLPGFGVVRRFVLHLAGRLRDLVKPAPLAHVLDLRDVDAVRDSIHPNASPLLVFHGWDPKNLVFDSRPDPDVLDDTGSRYRQMLFDLMDGTNGVYRPIFISYNTRDDLWDTSNRIARLLQGELQTDGIRGTPTSTNPDSGRFSSIDSFGFSMGGLAERTYQCWVRKTRNMVTLGTPHVGSLDQLQGVLTGFGAFDEFAAGFLRRVSPGTAQLLDYDHEATSASESTNPFLWQLNRDRCSSPIHGVSLIAGDDPASLFGRAENLLAEWIGSAVEAGILAPDARDDFKAVADALSIGGLAVGSPSDGVVPVTSALAKTDAGRPIEALTSLAQRQENVEDFSHFNVGFENRVPISLFLDRDILTQLSDWVVERGSSEEQLPTQDEEGFVTGEFMVDFNVPHGDVTGIVPVVYALDASDEWRIVWGADPLSHQPDSRRIAPLSGNSKAGRSVPVTVDAILAREVPDDPTTLVQQTSLLFVPIGPESPLVPPDPTQANFGGAER